MKILHISNDYYGTKLYKKMIDQLNEFDLINEVYVPVTNNYSISFEPEEHVYVKPCSKEIDRILFFTKANKGCKGAISHYDFSKVDVLHAHTLFSNGYIAYKLSKQYGIPYVVAVRNTDLNIFFKRMPHLRKLGVRILQKANKIVFLSESYRNETMDRYVPQKYKEQISEKTVIIPNGIDEFWLENIYEKREKKKTSSVRIITVGEINDNKNQLATVNICKKLIKEGYDVSCKLVGRIVDEGIYEQLTKNSFVKYLGVLSKEELITVFRNSDIFVLLSKTETFGLVYAEALTQGLPILYTKGQGFDLQFKDGFVGYSIEYENEIMAVKAIVKILEDYARYNNAALLACQKFSWKKICESYCTIYREIVGEKNKH